MVGIDVDNGGTTIQIYWTAAVILADGTDLGVLPKTLLPTPNVVHTWSYNWNPNTGVAGEFNFKLDNTIETIDLTAAQRAVGFSADALGFGGGLAPSNPNSGDFANIYTDNLSFTVPESASIVYAIISGAILFPKIGRRRSTLALR
jgi:hypothetical protein